MDKQNNIKTPGFWDCLMPGGALLLSYMLLFYLPEEFGWKGWLIIGISAFLFCIGYYGLLSSLPEPETPAGALARRLALVTSGVAIFLGGIYYVYSSDGSEKSIAIATLALIVPTRRRKFLARKQRRTWRKPRKKLKRQGKKSVSARPAGQARQSWTTGKRCCKSLFVPSTGWFS